MSAPWKNQRDPIAAYVCDDTTLDVVREVCVDMGWPPERAVRGGLRQAIQALSVAASPSILLVDLSESGDPLNDINALAEVCEPGTIVITIGQINDVRLYRDLLASGIQDYLLKPLSVVGLRDCLTQALEATASPRGGDGFAAQEHVSVAVIGTRGGAGASTIATSLAWSFSTDHKRPTALLDLDVHFGTGALTLDLEPGRGLIDAIDNPGRIDGLFIERAMIRANEHLALLSAEAPINSPLMTDGAAFLQLEEEFRRSFEATVIDLPRNILINFPPLLADTNVIVLVTELTLAGARDAIRILALLRSNAPQAQVLVVANKVPSGAGEISRGDFETSIERKIAFVVPLDAKGAANAARLGQTFVGCNASSRSAQVMRDMASAILASQSGDDKAEAGSVAGKATALLEKLNMGWLLSNRPKAGQSA